MSRRFKNRHARAVAHPDAEPAPPVVFDDSNSTVDPLQPDMRHANVLNTRHYAKAESVQAAEAAKAAADAAAAAAAAQNAPPAA